MILKTLVVGPLATNCYIVGSESAKEAMVIDPADNVEEIIQTAGKSKLDIKLIVLTHGHLDHIGGLKALKDKTGAEIAIHEAEVSMLQGQAQSLGAMFGLYYPAPPAPDRLLKEGDSLDIGDLQFKVLHTPGHTEGSICLYGNGVAFTGDTLFQQGIGRTDLPGGSYNQIIDSLQNKLLVLPEETVVYPGHGPSTTIGEERRGNPFLR